MLFKKSESPLVSFAKAAVVPVLTIVGSGVAAYVGASKGVADTVEAACKGVEKFIPTFEALITKAETAGAAGAASAEGEELTKYKEAVKRLMMEKAELEKAAAQPAAEAKAEAKPAETLKKEKKADKKSEAPKTEVNAEAEAEAK